MEEDKDKAKSGLPLATSLAISIVSMGLLVAHLVWPHARIDATTLALLGLALLPWLAPILKTIQVGGLKVELRDFRREVVQNLAANRQRVDALADRVEKLAVAFTGSVTPEQQQVLSDELDRFHAHLKDEDLDLPPVAPSVAVDEGLAKRMGAIAYYDPDERRIHIDSAYADDPDLILREYSHHVLVSAASGASERDSISAGTYAVESALADYFPCSFRDDPVPYRTTAARVGDGWLRKDLTNGKHFRRGESRNSLTPSQTPTSGGRSSGTLEISSGPRRPIDCSSPNGAIMTPHQVMETSEGHSPKAWSSQSLKSPGAT
jgi:hypothetical protein